MGKAVGNRVLVAVGVVLMAAGLLNAFGLDSSAMIIAGAILVHAGWR